jgi:type I restriction enzyme S subunit
VNAAVRHLWRSVPLKEIVEHSAFGPRFSGELYSESGNIATLRTTDLSPHGQISYESMPLAQIDENQFANHFLRKGDLVISRSGRIGTTAVFEGFELPVLPGAFLIRFRLRETAEPRFYRYFFNSSVGRPLILSVARGAAQQNINISNVERLSVPLPPMREQAAIVSIISSYDDLIENNRRRIALLEEAARMLYREWFVHFRFPGHEHVKIVNGLPEGWRITGVEEAYEGLFDGPHATPAPSDEGPVFLGIQNIHETGGLDLSSIRHVSEADFPRWTRRVTPREGDIVFSYEATLNRYALIPRGLRCCLGRRMALIRPKEEYRQFLYLHMFSDDWRRVIAGRVLNGATVDRIPLTSFPSFPILLPTRKVAVAFGETAEPQIKLIETLVEQNQKLAQARDLLLPRLMNGEIAV